VGFVVNDSGQVRGLVPVTRLVEIGMNGSRVPWNDVMTDAPVATTDTPLEEILPMAVESTNPVAVVDDKGLLVGEISHNTLLQVLAGDVEVSDSFTSSEITDN